MEENELKLDAWVVNDEIYFIESLEDVVKRYVTTPDGKMIVDEKNACARGQSRYVLCECVTCGWQDQFWSEMIKTKQVNGRCGRCNDCRTFNVIQP